MPPACFGRRKSSARTDHGRTGSWSNGARPCAGRVKGYAPRDSRVKGYAPRDSHVKGFAPRDGQAKSEVFRRDDIVR